MLRVEFPDQASPNREYLVSVRASLVVYSAHGSVMPGNSIVTGNSVLSHWGIVPVFLVSYITGENT